MNVAEQPAQEGTEDRGGRHRRPCQRLVAGKHGRAGVIGQTHVDVEATARQVFVELRHEGQRAAGLRRDLLGRQLVDHVPVGHLECPCVAQVDFVLPGPPLALAEFDRDGRSVHVAANRPDHGLCIAAGQDVIVLDIVLERFEVAPTLLLGGSIIVAEQEELELAPDLRMEAVLGETGELALQDLAR